MAITIQELLASDTISQAVDKINFNFDQLLLNGGGPVGPSGPLGPIGPTGGRGLRGSKWYEDPNATATNPNTLIFSDVEADDNYLDADGSVWNYNGTVWTITTVNLTGPTGSSGLSAGFAYFGNNITTGQQSIYPTPSPDGTGAGATVANEGIPTLVVGAVVSSTVNPPSGVTLTDAYKLTNTLATSIDSPITAMFVHQKDSSANAIVFHGGGAIAAENFEQNDLSNLANIKLDADDKLQLNVPKPPTSPANASDLLSFSVNTLKSGQQYYSGKQIQFSTGNDTALALASEISDFTITVNTSNTSNRAKFQVSTTDINSSALFQLGGNITVPTSTTKTGTILLEGNSFNSITSGTQQFTSATNTYNFNGLASVSGTGSTGFVTVDNGGRLRSLNLSGGGAFGNGVLSISGGNIQQSTGTNSRIARWDGTTKIEDSGWGIADVGRLYPVGGAWDIGQYGSGNIGNIYIDDGKAIVFNRPSSSSKFSIRNSDSVYGVVFYEDGRIHLPRNVGSGPDFDYDDSIIRISNPQSTPGGRIEFESGGTSMGEQPGIWGPKGQSISDNPGHQNAIMISGGDGLNYSGGSYTGYAGRDVYIKGGDSQYSTRYGGDVYLYGGRFAGTGFERSGIIHIGLDPDLSIPQGREIRIGANTGEGYVSIKRPGPSYISGDAEDYALAINTGVAKSVSPSAITMGGFVIKTNDTYVNDPQMLQIHVHNGASFFNPLTQTNDAVIISSQGGDGDLNGLVIGQKDERAAIRFDGVNQVVQVAGQQGVNATDVEDVKFKVDASINVGQITISSSMTTIPQVVNPDEAIFSSGTAVITANNTGGGGTAYCTWFRIGRVVHMSCSCQYSTGAGDRVWLLPIKGNGGNNTGLRGAGTAYQYSGVAQVAKPVFVQLSGNKYFKIFDSGSTVLQQGLSETQSFASVNFTYRLV